MAHYTRSHSNHSVITATHHLISLGTIWKQTSITWSFLVVINSDLSFPLNTRTRNEDFVFENTSIIAYVSTLSIIRAINDIVIVFNYFSGIFLVYDTLMCFHFHERIQAFNKLFGTFSLFEIGTSLMNHLSMKIRNLNFIVVNHSNFSHS